MKTNKIIDERVIAQKRAISSDAFGIVYNSQKYNGGQ